MKRILIALLASIAIMSGVTQAPAQAVTATECDGVLTGTYTRLVVSSGSVCDLEGATVNGNVRILAGGALISHGSTINGSVLGDGALYVLLYDTDVIGTGSEGNINLTGTLGRIVIGNAGCLADPAVGNNITLIGNHGSIAICFMTVGGTITVQDNDGPRIGINNNVVGVSLIVQGNTVDRLNLRFNDVGSTGGGSINFQDNTATARLFLLDNNSHNAFNCTGNTPPPVGSGNTADNGLNDQCAALV